jgi:hypothetical protein
VLGGCRLDLGGGCVHCAGTLGCVGWCINRWVGCIVGEWKSKLGGSIWWMVSRMVLLVNRLFSNSGSDRLSKRCSTSNSN